jgi:hypothetical protein
MINWGTIKKKRDYLLLMTDYTQLSDNTLTDAKKAEWRIYRQALRDLPQTYSSATDKSDVIWPTKPS